jgi:HPt (histidine-containing phosphotransfer) domain-containing protein
LACLAAGMNGHVGKPFEMGELVALLLVLSGREAPVVDGPSEVLPNLQGAFVAVPYAENPAPLRGLLESPYLDVAAALDRLSGLTELYLDIAPEFVKSLDTVEEEFRQAAAQSQWPALTVQMHSLKGVSATLGAVALSQHAARLERLFHTPSADLVALDHLPDLLKLVAATRAAMQSALQVLATEAVQEPEPERLPAGPAGRARARAFIAELMDLLATQNLAVLECFARRSDALDALSKVCVDDLQAALQSLNLVRARQLCETHMHSLAVD